MIHFASGSSAASPRTPITLFAPFARPDRRNQSCDRLRVGPSGSSFSAAVAEPFRDRKSTV